MTNQEARDWARAAIQKLIDTGRAERDRRYCIGQAVGMVKAFKAAGIIDGHDLSLLDELEEMI